MPTLHFNRPAKQLIEVFNNAEHNLDEYLTDDTLKAYEVKPAPHLPHHTLATVQDPDDGYLTELLIPTHIIESIN